ncbi:dihydroorotate dehydrogenase-like protein [Carboxylicivirga sp. RSCT41]|uniref:dihydroorotate dehydrogenase-like protein n=1 Tax=Carboxylicivirga agarovorans TaxID=3417570 RepID=UPI003D3286E5
MPDISTTYLGLKLKSPIIAASSGLTNSLEDIKNIEKAGAGAVVLKSLFEEEIVTEMERDLHRLHSENHLYPETMDYYDTFDVENTLSDYLRLVTDCKKEVNIPVIASINCITSHNWPSYARTLQDAGADALELNIFSLPSDIDRKAEDNEKVYFDIIEAVLKEVNIPVSIKISHYFSNLADMITRLSKSGIAGMTLFNRFYSPDIDVDNLEVIPTHIFSQEHEYTMPLRWIAITSNRVECDLAATTGIHDSRTAIKMLLAGAKVVQMASTLYKNGVESIERFNYEIDKWMDKHNYKTIADFQGALSQSNAANPAGYLRVQFMKQFSQK